MARKKGVKLQMKLEGIDDLVDEAERIGGAILADVKRIIRKYALKVERTAKKLAPVDEGRLRASIRAVLKDMAAAVLTDVFYAAFQEFGTGRRGAASGVDPVENYVYGPSKGIPPTPFMRPALERHAKDFIREVREVVKRRL